MTHQICLLLNELSENDNDCHINMVISLLNHLGKLDIDLLYACHIKDNQKDGIMIRWAQYNIFCDILDGEYQLSFVRNRKGLEELEFQLFEPNQTPELAREIIKIKNGRQKTTRLH